MAKKAELVPATDQTDLGFIKEAGAGIVEVWKQAAKFFKKADELEARSREVLDLAKSMAAPTTAEEDENVQKFIKRVGIGKVTVGGHWDGTELEPGITRLVYRIHRRLTAKRDASIKLLDDAARIANKLHNDYVTEANRRAEAERMRLQKIEDDRAKAERDAELAGLNKRTKAGREQAKAIAAAPLQATIVDVKPDVVKAAGTSSRVTHSPNVVDLDRLIAAAFAGEVPRDVLCLDEVRLRKYTRDVPDVVRRWPGVQVVEDKKVV